MPSFTPTTAPPAAQPALRADLSLSRAADAPACDSERPTELPPAPGASQYGESAAGGARLPPALVGGWVNELRAAFAAGNFDDALARAEAILAYDPCNAEAQSLAASARLRVRGACLARCGSILSVPRLRGPLTELAEGDLDPRAAFVASLADGTLTIADIVDVSGTPELEALHTLVSLFDRGILSS